MTLAYRNVLHREPDPVGLTFWLDQLQRGASRGQVMLGFSESVEFIQANGQPIPGPDVWDPRTRPVSGADVWASYRPGCPVGPASLRRLVLQYWDFAGALRVGEVIARDAEVPALLFAFNRACTQRFPLWKMVRVDVYGGDDVASMADGNTSAFNCRRVTGNPTKLSQHSYGNAIDINTRQNPYGTCCRIFPAGWEYYYYNRNGRQGQMMPGGTINHAIAQSLALPGDPLAAAAGSFVSNVTMPPGLFLHSNSYVGVTLRNDANVLPPNAATDCPLREMVRVAHSRWTVEDCFLRGKQEVGLDDYEVRGWRGYHHHMTLVMLALWFLVLQKRRLGGKNRERHDVA